ncbi:hypothetical protein DRO64_00180 [Candidatus Bathyarchaeota archaeon]|nr:MAG: hypothetical protein DRO64_00180 [Candidatus Bathyarchaeota archaeon]
MTEPAINEMKDFTSPSTILQSILRYTTRSLCIGKFPLTFISKVPSDNSIILLTLMTLRHSLKRFHDF